jgi:uncharacterized protein
MRAGRRAPLCALAAESSRRTIDAMSYRAPAGLRGPHRQTVFASRARKPLVHRSTSPFRIAAERHALVTEQGVQLEAWVNRQFQQAPLVILIHGWLGDADSSYVASAAHALWRAGFTTARLNLRDHGNTSALNEALFHSARLDEVVDACRQLGRALGGSGTGLVGFSLGGNFALRIARHLALETLAICPVIEPGLTTRRLDGGPRLYGWWFLRKWRRAMRAKAQAFPELYDFRDVYSLGSLTALTEYFVANYTEFRDAQSYWDAYRILPESVRGAPVRIIAAADDPVIPAASVLELRGAADVTVTNTGGHCGFIDSWRMTSWLDRAILEHFERHFRAASPRALAR